MPNIDLTRIASNIGALNALQSLQTINNQLAIHQARLQTGKRINQAADDPSGLVIATKLNARSEGLKQALNNIGDAKNLLSVAEAGLGKINEIMIQMKNVAMQAATDTAGSDERSAASNQITSLLGQINDVVTQTQWNGTALISGSSSSLSFLTGPGASDTTSMATISNMSASGLSVSGSSLTGSSSASAFTTFMGTIDTAMNSVSSALGKVGSLTQQLTFKEQQVSAAQINVESSYSRIMNANMAEEQVNASKYMILQQTATAMLAQSNTAPQFLLSLFR